LAVIDEFGGEHEHTGHPIFYTSADSVFQVAAHEEHFGLERLYSNLSSSFCAPSISPVLLHGLLLVMQKVDMSARLIVVIMRLSRQKIRF